MDQKRESVGPFGRIVRPGVAILIIILVILFINKSIQDKKQELRDEYFLDNQVIVIVENSDNQPNPISKLTEVTEVTLELVDSISITPTISSEQTQFVSATLQGVKPNNCDDIPGYTIYLYKLIGNGDNVEAAYKAINAIDGVIAEPNWVIGTPWSPTGSPWSPTGSSSSGNPMPAIKPDYQEQWAFTSIGLYDATPVEEKHLPVRIGVFDTSPIEDTSIEGEDPLSIEYRLPEFIATPVPPEPGSPEDIRVANHGYFGAGFIREIAPESEIQLIRVLTENNRGDLFTLNRELLNFLVTADKERIPAVVNMSLGIPPLVDNLPFDFDRALKSLKIITEFGECLDVVMIAAAGNDSAQTLHPSNYPAAWDTVLGVSASNRSNELSCFTNTGDVAAPGGEGGPDDNSGATCVPRLDLCPGSGPSCPYAVISYVHPAVSGDKYQYWVGTSFSTPMVTGLAALLRQLDNSLSASEIRRLIICGANTSSGPASVIRIPETLDCAGIEHN